MNKSIIDFYSDWDLWAVKGRIGSGELGARGEGESIGLRSLRESVQIITSSKWIYHHTRGNVVEQGGVIRSLLTVELQGEVARGSCLATKRYNNFGDRMMK